ncbi:MAG: hypothetical protein M3Q64_02535 [bacterium]|nr:hypothetical protein [bacterium]
MENNDLSCILITGPIGSGKTMIGDYIKQISYELYSLKSMHFSFSGKLDQIIDPLHPDKVDRRFKQALGLFLDNFDKSYLTNAILKDISLTDINVAIISSVRFGYQISAIKNRIPNTIVIHLTANKQKRWLWVNARRVNEGDPPLTIEEFQDQHKPKTDHNLGRLRWLATHIIKNNGTKQELYAKVNEAMHHFIVKSKGSRP